MSDCDNGCDREECEFKQCGCCFRWHSDCEGCNTED